MVAVSSVVGTLTENSARTFDGLIQFANAEQFLGAPEDGCGGRT